MPRHQVQVMVEAGGEIVIFLLLFTFWTLWFLNFSTRTVLAPLLPIFERQLHISHALAGSIFFFLSIGYTLSLLLSGWLTIRAGFKKTIILGTSILAVALFALTFTSSYLFLASVALCLGFGAGLYLPSAIPILTNRIAPEKWGKAIAFHETAASFSILAIPLLAALMLRFFEWTALIFMLSGGCLVAVSALVIIAPDPRQEGGKSPRFFTLLKRKNFWAMAIPWGFAGASSLGLYNLIPLFLVSEKGMALETANTVFGFSRLGGLVFTFLAGFLADRYGVRRVLCFSLLVTGASTLGTALAQSFTLLVILLALQATFTPMFFPISLVAISKLTEFHERSLFTG